MSERVLVFLRGAPAPDSLGIMHNPDIRARSIAMCRAGVPNAEIARSLDVPKGTVGSWKFDDRTRNPDLYPKTRAETPYCPRCDGAELDRTAYSYLLGLYLGDGCITKAPQHRVHTLTIACGDAWPGLIEAASEALRAVAPPCGVTRLQRVGMTEVKMYSSHWVCMFPQHGPGMKHTRKIELADWQSEIVESHPWEFIRGLIHSDGCRITNWTEKVIAGERKRYEYTRYFFSNVSSDIRDLYCWALDVVGVEWRYANWRNISVAKKNSIALMDLHVGPKF
ncbi:hypothetical protein ABH935_007584 [Catenulispora sp. GAS73]|uniref:helix-turn-helix domain-containing protein n=1 Tax=Catenulispora sp. GAS73 TaxID=3156269 RepID=UPI003511E4BB